MGWLDASEYFLIVATARDRVDDLLSATELAIERAAIADQRSVTEPARFRDTRGRVLRAFACLAGSPARGEHRAAHRAVP
jgi:hypothetical protein